MTERVLVEGGPSRITSITPEFLPPEDKIKELYGKLLDTQQGWTLLHDTNLVQHKKRGVRVTSSGWEDWIPAVHAILKDGDFNFERKPRRRLESLVTSKFSVMGTALHELSALTSLINFGKLNPSEISKAFPTYKELALIPYVDALTDAYGVGLYDIWEKFRDHPGLMDLIDEEEKLLIKEFDIPLSEELQEELSIRRGPEVYDAGCKLIPFFLSQTPKDDDRVYLETGTVFNWDKLSLQGDTRVQILNRFDDIYSHIEGKGKAKQFFVEFSDLKTGVPQMDYSHCFQALVMHFMAGHFMDNVMRKGLCYRNSKGWYSTKSNYLVPYHTNYNFSHIYFDTTTGAVTNIPIKIDYQSEDGQRFLKWISFYSDAFNALRDEIQEYLVTGQLPEFSRDVYTQHELPLFRERESSQEKYEGPYYYINSTITSDEPCYVCGETPTKETSELKTDMGGLKSRISVRRDCKHHWAFDCQTINVDSRALVFPSKR